MSTTGINITKEFVQAAAGVTNLAALDKIYPYLKSGMLQAGIDTPQRALAFLAQVGTESAGLSRTEEFASGEDYEGRCSTLGNCQTGDGVRFKGRGLIQLTGRSNYRSLGKATGINAENNPGIVAGKWVVDSTPEQLKNSVLASTWFWNNRNLNQYADQMDLNNPSSAENIALFRQIGYHINGKNPPNGDQDRLSRLASGFRYYNQHKATLKKQKMSVASRTALLTFAIGAGAVGATLLGIYLYKKYKK